MLRLNLNLFTLFQGDKLCQISRDTCLYFKRHVSISKNERHLLLYHGLNGMPSAVSKVGAVDRLAVDKSTMQYH